MKTLLTLLALLLPLPALASGFYLPWWLEAALWLFGTFEGLALLIFVVVVVLLIAYEVARS